MNHKTNSSAPSRTKRRLLCLCDPPRMSCVCSTSCQMVMFLCDFCLMPSKGRVGSRSHKQQPFIAFSLRVTVRVCGMDGLEAVVIKKSCPCVRCADGYRRRTSSFITPQHCWTYASKQNKTRGKGMARRDTCG